MFDSPVSDMLEAGSAPHVGGHVRHDIAEGQELPENDIDQCASDHRNNSFPFGTLKKLTIYP